MTREKIGGLILVGGLGTRLRPLTLHQPKALLPILNRPFLSFQFAALARARVNVVCLAANPWFRKWKREITSMAPRGMRLIWAFETTPLGTGGAIRFGFDRLCQSVPGVETLIVFNGDVLIEADLTAVTRYHHRKKSSCTLALTRVNDSSRFGLVESSRGGRIRWFHEKPKGRARPGWINAGLYIMSWKFAASIPAHKVLSVERDIFPARLAENWPIYSRRIPGYWNDIGTPSTYLKAHADLMARKRSWTGFGNLSKGSSLRRGVRVLRGSGSSLPADLKTKGFVCIGSDVRIELGVSIQNSVIMDGCRIGRNSRLTQTILGRRCVAGEGSVLSAGTVVGERTRIPDFSKI